MSRYNKTEDTSIPTACLDNSTGSSATPIVTAQPVGAAHSSSAAQATLVAEIAHSASELQAAVMNALKIADLQKGQNGWVHFLFSTHNQASGFIKSQQLRSESPGNHSLKQPDNKRHHGYSTVRTSPGLYAALRTRIPSLPEASTIEPAAPFRSHSR